MSKHSSSTTSNDQEERLPLTDLKKKLKVILSPQVLKAEAFLCNEHKTVEWSGIILWKITDKDGELISDTEEAIEAIGAEKAVIMVDYLYPMDIGSSGYTEFENHHEILDLFEDRPEYEESHYRHGLIHSHNSMGTFFSGTDKNQLVDGVRDFDAFLSVITNNKSEIIGRFAFEQTIEHKVKLFGFNKTTETKSVGYMDCEIIRGQESFEDEVFFKRHEALKEAKAKLEKTQEEYRKKHGGGKSSLEWTEEELQDFYERNGYFGHGQTALNYGNRYNQNMTLFEFKRKVGNTNALLDKQLKKPITAIENEDTTFRTSLLHSDPKVVEKIPDLLKHYNYLHEFIEHNAFAIPTDILERDELDVYTCLLDLLAVVDTVADSNSDYWTGIMAEAYEKVNELLQHQDKTARNMNNQGVYKIPYDEFVACIDFADVMHSFFKTFGDKKSKEVIKEISDEIGRYKTSTATLGHLYLLDVAIMRYAFENNEDMTELALNRFSDLLREFFDLYAFEFVLLLEHKLIGRNITCNLINKKEGVFALYEHCERTGLTMFAKYINIDEDDYKRAKASLLNSKNAAS